MDERKKLSVVEHLRKYFPVKSGAFKGINAKATIKCPRGKKDEYRKILQKKGVPKTAKFK